VNDSDRGTARPKRADARRNEQTLLDAAAAIFVASGVEAPIRDIAAKAGVGTATIYRRFPTRADLIVAVCTQLLDAAADSGEVRSGQDAYELMRGVGGLCAGAGNNPRYDARRLVKLLVAGLRRPH
jgi:AcrR family transcriptional regulator